LYHLSVKTVSRGTGRSAVACDAYRCATVLRDERTGQVHDYERKRGVEATVLLLPDGAAWAGDRERLWNAAEAAEKRKDARVAREYELALPHELDAAGRRRLVAEFGSELVRRYGVAVSAAIHAPGREGDQRNWHAHVLATTRRATAEGLGEKAAIELSDTARAKQGLGTGAAEIEALRAAWGGLVNRELERARVAERVDHRSYARQGLVEEATQHLGPAAAGMERKAGREARRQRQDPERTQEGRVQAWEVPGTAQERPGEATRAAPASVEALRPAPVPQAAQDGPGRARETARRVLASGGGETHPEPAQAAVRPSAGVAGAGAEPVTRIGQRNAEIQERNRAVQAARVALDAARRAVEGLERAAAAGRRWVTGLARGVGAQAVAEREARAREAERVRQEQARQEAARRAEEERQARERVAERERIAAELRRQEAARRAEPAPQTSQARRDAARDAAGAFWNEEARQGRALREAEQQMRQREGQAPRERRGPRLRM